MSQAVQCPECGGSLPDDAPFGLCPKCLLRGGLSSGADLQRAGRGTAAYRGPFVAPSPEELAPLFPQLQIVELLGQGGMGAVYKARQPHLDRMVALKILPPEANRDPSFAERFQREARALARLNHPNIVAVYDFGEARGPESVGLAPMCYFLMEYVDGVNLRQVLRAGQLEPVEALRIVPLVCEALHYAHEEGIVHRDIKPENILIDKKGRVKIADFGLAKLLGPASDVFTLTSPQQVMGTIHYMAPEQMEKPHLVDHRADIYSLGVVLYEMLTGELPLGRFPLPSEKAPVDARLDHVVLRTLEKAPERRYQRASEVKVAVEAVQAGDFKRVPPEVIPLTERADFAAPRPPARNDDMEQEMVRTQVKGPAAGLYLAAFLFVLAGLVGFVVGISLAPFERGGDAVLAVLLGIGSLLVGPLLGAVVFHGARQMARLQGYEWAVLASIVTLLTLPSPGFIVGLLGLWALITLRRPSVRLAFARQAMAPAANFASSVPRRSGSLPFSCGIHGGVNKARGLLRLDSDAILMEYQISYLEMANSRTREARIPLADIESIALRHHWYGTRLIIIPARLQAFDNVPGLEGGELRLNIAGSDRATAEGFVARVQARLGIAPEARPLAGAPMAQHAPEDPVAERVPEPRRRGPLGRMVHSFAKAAKNLFVETTVYTRGESFVAPPTEVPPAPCSPLAPQAERAVYSPQPRVVEPASISDDRVRYELIRSQVRPPAITLTLVGVINFLFWWCLAIGVWIGMRQPDREEVWVPLCLGFSVPVLTSVILLLVGARRMREMRSYGFSWFTTILASLPFGPGMLVGIPVGFWARSVLRRPAVREAFVRNRLADGALFPHAGPVLSQRLTAALFILLAFATILVFSIITFTFPHRHDWHAHPATVSTRDQFGRSVVYHHIGDAIKRGDQDWVRRFLRNGVRINDRTQEGKPPLAYAAEAGNEDMIRYLCVFEGADPNGQDTSGFTPLHFAARSGKVEAVRQLLSCDAKNPVAAANGTTPLMDAAAAGRLEVVQALLEDVKPRGLEKEYLDSQSNAKETALMRAAAAGHIEIVQFLIEQAADVNVVDAKGEAALYKAVVGGHPACVSMLLAKMAKPLIDQPTREGETALTVAAWKGNREICDLLIKAGAVEPPRLAFCRAYQLAMSKKYAEALPILLKLIEETKLQATEKSWHMVFDGWRYEIPLPFLTVHAVLAECYERLGQGAKKEEALKACADVWPESIDSKELILYTRSKLQNNINWTFKSWLERMEVEKHLKNTGKLPFRIQIKIHAQGINAQGGAIGTAETGAREGVVH